MKQSDKLLNRLASITDLYINNIHTGLPSLSIANGDPLKLTSPAQHASRWRMRGSQTCRLLCLCCQLAGCQDDAIVRGTGVYARKFRNEITRAMHAGQERWVWRTRGLAVSAAPMASIIAVKSGHVEHFVISCLLLFIHYITFPRACVYVQDMA